MLQMVGVGLGILAFILVRNLDSVICGATMTRFRAPIHMIGSSSSLMTCVFSDSSSVITLPMVCSDSSSVSVFHVPRSFHSRQKVRQLPRLRFSATSSSANCSTIDVSNLHFSVWNEKRCIPCRYYHHIIIEYIIVLLSSDYSGNPHRKGVCLPPTPSCKSIRAKSLSTRQAICEAYRWVSWCPT